MPVSWVACRVPLVVLPSRSYDPRVGTEKPGRFDLQGLLAGVERASPLDAVEVLAREFARLWHADAVSFLIADYSGDHLARLVLVGADGREPVDATDVVAIHSTCQGQVLRTQQPLVVQNADGVWACAPVSSRGEAIGVLELCLPAVPGEEIGDDLVAAAHVLAYVVVTNRAAPVPPPRRHPDRTGPGHQQRADRTCA